MAVKYLVASNRSYRRFFQDIYVELRTLKELADQGR
jgi:hypothetical protein